MNASATTQIVKFEQHALEPSNLNEAQALARMAVASRLFPAKGPEEALVILMTGRELGLTAMQSLRAIHVVQGRPVLSSDLMVALVRKSSDCEMWQIVESTPERCTIKAQRRGDPEPTTFSWTMEDASRAKLTGKDNWRMHPAAMLRARCGASLARALFPDLLMGIYDPDELTESRPTEPLRIVSAMTSADSAPEAEDADDPDRPEQGQEHPGEPALSAMRQEGMRPARATGRSTGETSEIDAITPWLRRIQEAEHEGSEEHLDAVRTEMNTVLKHRTRTQGEALRRAIETARAAIRAGRGNGAHPPGPETEQQETAGA